MSETQKPGSRQTIMRKMIKAASVLILLLILLLGHQHVMTFLKWPPEIYSDPDVFNLTKQRIEWDVYYGEPELCGKLECHLLDGYASANFDKKQVLPAREFPLVGYKKGQIIYYRTTVQVPPHLLGDEEILVFHSVHIWAEKYRFYVNGHFVDAGAKNMLNIAIPRHMVMEDGRLRLAFRIDPGSLRYQGLAHFGDLIIGPKHKFSKLEHVAHDLTHGFYLWHMLPRLTTCLVLVFFVFAVTRGTEIFMFVLYSFTSSMYVYLMSDLPVDVFGPLDFKGAVTPVLNVFSSVLFFALVHRFFRGSYGRLYKGAVAVGVALVLSMIALVFYVDLGTAHEFSNNLNYWLRIAGSAFAVYLAFKTWRYLKQTKKSRARQTASLVFLFFNACVLATYLLVKLKVIPIMYGPTTIFVSDSLLLIVFTALVGLEFGSTLVQKDHLNTTFRRFIGASVADSVVSAGARLVPVEETVSVMFCDIRSFTTMSEGAKPGAIFGFLNQYFEMMIKVIAEHNGVIDKFGGDSIMAVWGVPEKNPTHEVDAACCAVAMRLALKEFNERRLASGEAEVRIGIGIHSGVVMAGAIGSNQRQEYTVIGDTVNIASRIEGLTKTYLTDIIVSGSTWRAIEHSASGRHIGSQVVKGRTEPVELYALEDVHAMKKAA